MAARASCLMGRHALDSILVVVQPTLLATIQMNRAHQRQEHGLIIRCSSLRRMQTSVPLSYRHQCRLQPHRYPRHSLDRRRRQRQHHRRRHRPPGRAAAGAVHAAQCTYAKLHRVGALSRRIIVSLHVAASGVKPGQLLRQTGTRPSSGASGASGPTACSLPTKMRAQP